MTTLRRGARLPVGSCFAIAALSAFACGRENPERTGPVVPVVVSVEITPREVSFGTLGRSRQLVAAARDAAGNQLPNKSFTWTSTDPAVATVTSEGLVTAVGNGRATISVTSEGVSSSAPVTVEQVVATVIVSPPGSIAADVDRTVDLSVAVRDSAGNSIVGRPVTWASLNSDVATVTPTGDRSARAAARRDGQVIVSATVGEQAGYAVVTVVLPGPGPARSWTRLQSPIGRTLFGIWGSAANDVWVVGSFGGIAHYDGVAWRDAPGRIPTSQSIFAVWGTSRANVYAVGGGRLIFHFDGTTWRDISPERLSGWSFLDVWGSAPNDIWVVGENGSYHYDGVAWTPVPSVSGHKIWGTAANDVWVVSSTFASAHFDGRTWTRYMLANTSQRLAAVRGSAPDDVWAGGGSSTLWHFDGSAWTSTDGPSEVYDLWSCGPREVWGPASNGVFLRYDGSRWKYEASGIRTARLFAMWGTRAGDLWTVGENGTILRGTASP